MIQPYGTSPGLCGNAIVRFTCGLLLFALFFLPLSFVQTRQAQADGQDSALTFVGHHDSTTCQVISGWAWNSAQPSAHISVDIHSDGVLIGTVVANQFRQDLLDAGIGDGTHAFVFPVPESLKDNQPHTITVEIANSNIPIANTPQMLNCSPFDFRGSHDTTTCNLISGWAWDANHPDEQITVDVIFDNNPFSSIRAPANQFRQDLLDAGIGNGFHAFSFPFPEFLKDGQPHTVRIIFTGSTINLPNTEMMISCNPNPTPDYQGSHDTGDCETISGWAWDANNPSAMISVDIYNGPTLIATVVADQFRQDLLDAGIGNGFHAFVLPTPDSLKDGRSYSISVGFGGTAIGLPGTPKIINCSAALEGSHDGANCDTISGWAWSSLLPTTPINVDVYIDNVLFTTVPANQFRQDLLDAGKGNGFHAFVLATPGFIKDGQPHSIRIRYAGTNIDVTNTPLSVTCAGP